MEASEFVAGGTAGMAGIAVVHPLDTLRIRQQIFDPKHRAMRLPALARSIVANEGIRGMYKGILSPIVTVAAMNAALFCSFESASRILEEQVPRLDHLTRSILSGGIAGGLSALISGPTELVKCIAQANSQSRGTIREEVEILRGIIQSNGLGGLLRGTGLTVVRDSLSFAVYFGVYEGLCGDDRSLTTSFFAGGLAGVFAWGSIYPLDVIKTRWQVTQAVCMTEFVKQQVLQPRGLAQGMAATLLRAAPQHAVTFLTYEQAKKFLQ